MTFLKVFAIAFIPAFFVTLVIIGFYGLYFCDDIVSSYNLKIMWVKDATLIKHENGVSTDEEEFIVPVTKKAFDVCAKSGTVYNHKGKPTCILYQYLPNKDFIYEVRDKRGDEPGGLLNARHDIFTTDDAGLAGWR